MHEAIDSYTLGQAKLIIRFLFPPAWFFANTTKFSLYGNWHRMDFQIFIKFSLLYCNFHYYNNEVFCTVFSRF